MAKVCMIPRADSILGTTTGRTLGQSIARLQTGHGLIQRHDLFGAIHLGQQHKIGCTLHHRRQIHHPVVRQRIHPHRGLNTGISPGGQDPGALARAAGRSEGAVKSSSSRIATSVLLAGAAANCSWSAPPMNSQDRRLEGVRCMCYTATRARSSVGDTPVHRLYAREKLAGSEYPSR